jgi:hypothetical protein
MLLYRLVPEGGLWLRAMARAEADVESVIPEVVPFFVPNTEDKGWLSVYAIDNAAEADFVAAALRYNQGDIVACHFAGVDSDQLDAANIAWKQTAGQTYHPVANNRHHEINIPDIHTLFELMKLFARGTYFTVEQPRVLSALEGSAAAGDIDFDGVLRNKINGKVATRTLELVRSKHLTLKAADAAAA